MKEKILGIINNLVVIIKPKLVAIDLKFQSLVPNPKLRKILYVSISSLFGFMLLIILLGLLLSPLGKNTPSGLTLNKPKIETSTTAPQKELNETQKKLLDLETKVKEMRFPESTLNIPVLESDIKI